MWNELSAHTKLNILAGESTVMVELLVGCRSLMQLVRGGASKETCLGLINEQF